MATGKRRRDGVALFDLKTGTPLAVFHPEPRTPRDVFAAVRQALAACDRVAIVGEFHWIGLYQSFVAFCPSRRRSQIAR